MIIIWPAHTECSTYTIRILQSAFETFVFVPRLSFFLFEFRPFFFIVIHFIFPSSKARKNLKKEGNKNNKKDEKTYINFLPLVDVADESWQSEKPHEGEEFSQAKNPQSPAGLQDLKAFAKVLHP